MNFVSSMNLGPIYDLGADRKVSSDELRLRIANRKNIFYSVGLKRGDKVIISHGNNALFFSDLFALWELGVCAIPIDPTTSDNELLRLIEHSDAKAVISLGTTRNISAPSVTFLDSSALQDNTSSEVAKDQGLSWEDPALILYTSGTTGQPKGVLHTYRSLFARISSLKPNVGLDSLTKSLCLLPSHFGHGLICNSLFPLLNGCELTITPNFNLNLILRLGEIIDANEITFMSSVPTVWQMALKYASPPKKGTLKQIHCGSAPLSAALWKNIQEWSGAQVVKNTYGITETGSWLAGTENGKTDFIDGYIGKGWGTELAITSGEEEGFRRLSANEPGEVWALTPALMQGYYKRDDLTREVVKNGWFRTGDIGYLDNNGNLVLVGRKRNEINRAGMKVYPEDVDLVLLKHPQISDACVFAVPDTIAGQLVGAAIVLDKEKAATDTQEIQSWCKSHLPHYKIPTKWFVLNEIPRTSRGKINRDNVAKACLEPEA